jgi:peptidoglycan/LPS O-acetylase OafA/YrhL
VVIVTFLTVVFIEKAPERLHGYDSFGWFLGFAPNIAVSLKNNWLYHSHIFNLNHLWSLAVEEQFYLLWPLVVRFVPIRWLLLLCVVLISVSVPLRFGVDAAVGMKFSPASYVLPFTRMDGLAAGSFLAIFLRLDLQHFIPGLRWSARLLCLYTGWQMALIFMQGTEHRLYTLSALFFAGLLYLSLNTHPKAAVRRICENAFLCDLGKYSYGLYVFHQMFEYAWHRGFGDWLLTSGWPPVAAQIAYMLLAFGGTYALARLSWRLIEQPFLKMK